MHGKITAIAITGPTASGKTALSLKLAEALSGEIISLDSMQIYRGMDIGTAKATADERARVRHHMLDIIPPTADFSAQDYKRLATECARDIASRGRLPIFVGGTGLYLDTLTRNMSDEVPEASRDYIDTLPYDLTTDEGREALHKRLSEVDPESALAIHKNNVRRVARALEIFDKTGKTKSYFDALSRESSDFDILHITLDFQERELLYERIDARVGIMMSEGLLSEVRTLASEGLLKDGTTAAAAIGYKELLPAISGDETLDECVEKIKAASRAYAKRQLTWFRHSSEAHRIMCDKDGRLRTPEDILAEALCYINDRL
ncbi:MAG: tRNA (adenosine(37)-N6)-dimethylallyltransferase MiaA [Clostridia bacterium]|nr:tRNA (adenosine(37)-N6)-dimethylallyltransferase MiaA [Clostridia bacterium]